MLKPSTPLALRPGERVHLIVMRQPDPKRWDLSRLAESRTAHEAVLAEQGLEGWPANLDAEPSLLGRPVKVVVVILRQVGRASVHDANDVDQTFRQGLGR